MDKQSATRRQGPLVIIPCQVADRFTAEIQAHPCIEVGGKYLGFIRGASRCQSLVERQNELSKLILEVTDYLDDGPNAERTGGFHMGDADWQTREFRKLEQQNPNLEQLGSWHSHHPNGMGTLSRGDIDGYMATVNDRGHNHDFFFVSLGVDRSGFTTARHYLFVRGDKHFYELSAGNVRVTKGKSDLQSGSAAQKGLAGSQLSGSASAHDAAQPGARHDDTAAQHYAAPAPGANVVQVQRTNTVAPDQQAPGSQWGGKRGEMQSAGTSQTHSSGPADNRGAGRQLLLPEWNETPSGRELLAREKEILRDQAFAGIRLSVVQGRLMAKGSIMTDKDSATISLLYPSAPGGHDGLLKIATATQPQIELTVPGELSEGLEQAVVLVHKFLGLAHAICRTDSLGGRVLKQLRGKS